METNQNDISDFIDKQVSVALSKLDFWEFCLYYDFEFFSKRPFLKQVANAFQKIHDGIYTRISVSMSPRAGKSYLTTLFCGWVLGKKPMESVMRNTCTARLYEKFSYDVRNVVKNEKFKDVFPDVKLAEDKQAVTGWNLTNSKQVAYFGAGVGGSIIGFGASALAITDDLYKSMEDALSENVNEKTLSWKDSAHDSRLEKHCPQIDIGTRWTINDVIGRGFKKGYYDESIVIPALIDGKSFCEDVKTTDEYLKIKSEIDSTIWDAEYMQEPVEKKGLLFNIDELRYYEPTEAINNAFESCIGYGDIADEGSDSLSFIIGKNIGPDIYIPDLVFNKLNTNSTLPMCQALCERHKVIQAHIESNSMGSIFIKELRKLAVSTSFYGITSTTNKHTRILMASGFIKKHFVFLKPELQNDEYKAFMKELCSYTKEGKSKHDDAPDSASGLWNFIYYLLGHLY